MSWNAQVCVHRGGLLLDAKGLTGGYDLYGSGGRYEQRDAYLDEGRDQVVRFLVD